ncbi:MAG: DUF4249 domain-containing protein [Melioribacter sp.]|nr:DUF4249 domain-containing protein [Melioribacter sp.]
MKKITILIIMIASIIISCGEGTVDIGESTYAPKIVIEGYLVPEQKVKGIKITRNFPINTVPNPLTLILYDADVKIIDMETSKEYKLTFNQLTYSFEYNGNDLNIGYNKSYKILVTAVVDNKKLTASSITTTPQKGFKIIREESILDSMKYRERDFNSKVKNFKIVFRPSQGTSFYLFSILALDADTSTFIFENPYFEIDKNELKKYFDNYKYQLGILQNINSSLDKINYEIEWLDTWFYGKYRVIVYAGDENFRRFVLTYRSVQEIDGNFHDPQMKIDGDGIGIFGSYIADTVYFKILK